MHSVDGFDFLPYSVSDAFVLSVTHAQRVVNVLDDDEFDLLLRAVDLVVLAQAFSEETFAAALDLSSDVAHHLTRMLVSLDVLSSDEIDGSRLVLADLRDLPLILLRLSEGRNVWSAAA